MVGITIVFVMVGIVLVQTAVVEEEESLHTKFSKLEGQVKVLSQKLQQKDESLLGLQKQVDLLNRQLKNVTGMQPESKRRQYGYFIGKGSTDPDEVAFTVELTQELTNVPIHTIVIFDHAIHWTSDTYDTSTGVFTCPSSGLYLFAVFIQPHLTDNESIVSLKMDGTSYMTVISEISYSGEDDIGENVVLLDVSKGQRLWVETTDNDNQSFWKGTTTFSGVLIHRH